MTERELIIRALRKLLDRQAKNSRKIDKLVDKMEELKDKFFKEVE